jgi:hypothetical protein
MNQPTDRESRGRRAGRIVVSLWAIGGGLVFVWFLNGWLMSGIPVPWVGYVMIAFGVLGLIGINVFRGGPLDKRHDPPLTPPPLD